MQLTNFWTGKNKLWQAWWIVGFGSSLFSFSFFMTLIYFGNFLLPIFVRILYGTFILLLLLFSVVNPIVIWRCSVNSKTKIWRLLARILLCAGILQSLFNSPHWSGPLPPIPIIIRGLIIILMIVILFSWPKFEKITEEKKEFVKYYYIVPWCMAGGYLLTALDKLYYWLIYILQRM